MRSLPTSRALDHEPSSSSSSQWMHSALMNPRWKSLWMTPAHSGALAPARKVHARDSFSPVVRNVRSPSSERAAATSRGRAPSPRPSSLSISARSSATSWATSASSCTHMGSTSTGVEAPANASTTGAASASASSSWSSPTLTTTSTGLFVSRNHGRSTARCSTLRPER